MEKTIIDYKIVGGYGQDHTQKDVLEYIKDGYIPIGGVTTYDGKTFYQAMIKYSNKV